MKRLKMRFIDHIKPNDEIFQRLKLSLLKFVNFILR